MWDRKRPSHRMSTCHLLFLLLILLFTCQVRVKADVSVDNVHISFEPSRSVDRATQVTVKCQAIISRGQSAPRVELGIMKDNRLVMNTTDENAWEHPIASARAADMGTYKCLWSAPGKQGSSEGEKLKVTGTATPILTVGQDKRFIQEGDEVNATCSAPGERGPFIFSFSVDNKEVHEGPTESPNYNVKLQLKKSGHNKLTCQYKVKLYSDTVKSDDSTPVIIDVKEINVQVSLTVNPSTTIFEADKFQVLCKVTPQNWMQNVSLMKGGNILNSGPGRTEHSSAAAQASDAGEYMCKVEVNAVSKIGQEMLTVKELFSTPTMRSVPEEPFEGDSVQLICQSANISLERIKQVKYSIFKNGIPLPLSNRPDPMVVIAGPSSDGNYTCLAEAKSISKKSPLIIFKSKVLASRPQISVKGTVILGRNFQVKCNSSGTLPINYTLFRGNTSLGTQTVYSALKDALFTTNISRKEHISSFWCRAQNSGSKKYTDGGRLNTFVVEPLGKPFLTTLPVPENVEEGKELILICNVPSGTPPITFKWFSTGSKPHLHTGTVNTSYSNHTMQWMEIKDSAEYYCEASNAANRDSSNRVSIKVSLATWKKGLIVVVCLLVVAALVIAFIVRYKAKRGKRETTTELSVKPAGPKSDDSLAVNMDHETAFLNKDAVSLSDTTERNASGWT
ncbi:hypothetical protein ACEWY4_018198 [Coilia grayii]|uniref:Platelet endothelial cell adhesion molecule n=1 Tax=Coilia grayii TaxID=363190 RepID=A0ABD1JJ00_9TELE